MVQLTRNGAIFTGSPGDLRSLRARFQRDHYIILPKLIEPELFQMILQRVETAPFERQEGNGTLAQSVMADPATYDLMLFLANMPSFHRLIQRITGCRRIADFQGRIYRLNPSTSDRIVWHSDVCYHRLITLSLNLTTHMYRGGAVQIKHKDSGDVLHEIHNTGLGDALVMRVARKLRHCVLPVEGNVARTAMAGWFCWNKQDYHANLRSAAQSARATPTGSDAELNII